MALPHLLDQAAKSCECKRMRERNGVRSWEQEVDCLGVLSPGRDREQAEINCVCEQKIDVI